IILKNTKQQDVLITKGALESILPICTQASIDGKHVRINEVSLEEIKALADQLNDSGMHAIAVCAKRGQFNVSTFSIQEENEMVFLGLIAFLDPPKSDVPEAIRDLYAAGVDVKVISGDAPLMVQHICREVGLKEQAMLNGDDIENFNDEELAKAVETTNIFARVAPMQKQRIVKALKTNGHVVGYMGDGVNDAPSLRAADVGISVDTATDVAKASSSIILLKKSLSVILDGVYEGRRIYGNIIKYMKMALSSNFGNVFSVLVASIFLPFLPMLPVQMLIQNLVYDFTQIALPWDNVDPEFLKEPRRWDTRSLASFMNVMGLVSSLFDVATFAILWFIMGFSTLEQQSYFQTGWFIEGLISQVLIVQFVRTAKVPFIQSRCDYRLGSASAFGVIAALAIPYVFREIADFHFIVMPQIYYLYLVIILVLYAIAIQLTKKFYIQRHNIWL
ncbi:MAG: HAD family hydrolase, partial [Erysipelotrichia bacterium]|nr:HAD family hydrolase [Erysipelotrichia bacterium]